MRRALLLFAILLAPLVLAGCADIRQQRTTMLFYLGVSEAGVPDERYVPALGEFSLLEVMITHVTLEPNTTGAQDTSLIVGKRVDLVALRDAGPEKLLEAKIPYYVYDEVSVGVNVTNALLTNGAPATVLVPPNNIFTTGQKPFQTRLAGSFAYTFSLAVKRQVGTEDVYIIQSVPGESGANRA